jgi:CubicO group peptidase (beta-lactamase class C family)
MELQRELRSEPGTAYLYSNLGYVVAGVVAEKLGGGLWEKVIEERLFKPLGMKMGFGGTGTLGQEDQPWPHGSDGQPMPRNGPEMDNPPELGPAGTCHGALAEYAKFLADYLRGAAGKKALLPQSIYTDLATPSAGVDYALGWSIPARDWAGGTALNHAGSNTMNYALTWMAPLKGFAVVACCNQGGPKAAAACDEACGALIAQGK